MPVFTNKTSTDPGPFDALRPGPERKPAPGIGAEVQKEAHSALGAADEASEMERLYRFQEIPVSADMRRELLGAKLPLASADQLADTQPPYKSALSAPAASPPVDRHAPTEPALSGPLRAPDEDSETGELPLADTGRYSTTAPTLLSVRRRRLRNQRLVGLALVAMLLAIFSGVAWRRYTRQHEATARAASTAPQAPRIAGNRPAVPTPPRAPNKQAGDPIEAHEAHDPAPIAVVPAPDSENAQQNAPESDATSSSPLSASAESANLPEQQLTGTTATQKGINAPSKRKAFDPEELIF